MSALPECGTETVTRSVCKGCRVVIQGYGSRYRIGPWLTESGGTVGQPHVPGGIAGRQRDRAGQVAGRNGQAPLLVDVLQRLRV